MARRKTSGYPRLMPTPLAPMVPELIARLGLQPHPEGGWYRETHRSPHGVHSSRHGQRAAFTSILFLLEAPQVSHLHRLDAEELWNWHAGSPLAIRILTGAGVCETRHLGPDPGQSFQTVVPAGEWFGAEVATRVTGDWSLVGCAVAPGFEFSKFELADRSKLTAQYPFEAELIRRLT
jgi:predicted cupin superfamily sugar epimerase